MNKISLYLCLFVTFFSYSQSQEYYFNNNLQGTNGGGDLTSVLSCSATTGGFSSNIITTTAGLCGTFDTYCFNEGEGFAYPNTGITDEYTINMFFKFNSLSGYSRLIDFSNGTKDTGFYILNDCLNLYPNGNIGACPFFLPNIYYLLTFVRNSTTNFISVYVNGTLFGSYSDAAGAYKLATNSTPIIFFRDDMAVTCEDKPGCVKYISITPNTQSASQVNATWLNVCNIVNPCPTLPIATITASIPAQNICSGTGTNIQFSGTPNATVTYNVNNGTNQTIILDATGNATLATGNLSVNTTYSLVSAALGVCFQIQSGSEKVTINPKPTATISGTPSICKGSNTNLNIALTGTQPWSVTYTDGVTPVTATGITVSPFTPTISPSTTKTYSVTTVSDANCTGTFSGTEIVTVNPKPTVVTVAPAAVCSPSTVDLTAAAVTTGSTAGLTYTYWTDAAATVSYTTPSTATAGTYYIKGTTADGCIDIKSVVVTVDPKPTVVTVAPAAVCSSSTVDLTAAAVTTGSTAGLTYTYWTDAAATLAYAKPSSATAGTYYIKGTTVTGCIDIKSVVVTVNPKPTVVTVAPAAVCSPSTVDLTAAAVTTGSTAGLTYTYWTDAAATVSYTTPSTATAGTYYIKGTTVASCIDIKSVSVRVNPKPTATISGSTAICIGTGTNITFTGTPNTTVTYKINTGSNQTIVLNATGIAAIATGNLTTTTSYDLVSVLLGTCSQPQTGNATVSINALPTATISGTTAICTGTGTNITFSGTPNAIITYKLNSDSYSIISLDATGKAILPTGNLSANAIYTLVKVSSGACSQNQSGTATITVIPNPIITSHTGSNIICVEWKTNILLNGLTLESNRNNSNYTFQWQLNNIDIPGATSSNYSINSVSPGAYKVLTKSISPLGCINESNEFIVDQSGPASPSNPKYTVSNFFSENQSILAHIEGFGKYEYSLDGNSFQSNNTFNNVPTGTHTIVVKDINSNCEEIIIENIQTVDYPHYFTPNNDGINDLWTINGLDKKNNIKITIFDRFGKLIKVIQSNDNGWDGTLNGYDLPPADYWFSIDYIENNQPKLFKSHFSLIR